MRIARAELGALYEVRTGMIVRALITACVALLAACAAQPPAPTARTPGSSASTQIAKSRTQEAEGTVSPSPAESRAEAEPKPETESKAERTPEPKPETKPAPKLETKPKPKPPTPATQPAPPQTKPPSIPAAPAPAASAPAAAQAKPAPLDLPSLEERLKQTDAIGLLTKLSLKNQVDDLVGEFRAYHRGVRPPTLSQLRPAFELLLMKVLSLLQDKDPALAHDVGASREAIWAVLIDPRKLAEFS